MVGRINPTALRRYNIDSFALISLCGPFLKSLYDRGRVCLNRGQELTNLVVVVPIQCGKQDKKNYNN